jgi:hypothetical protein
VPGNRTRESNPGPLSTVLNSDTGWEVITTTTTIIITTTTTIITTTTTIIIIMSLVPSGT